MRSWLLAARPKTLTAAVIPVVLGTALARSHGGRVLWVYALLALAGALLIQIATNLINDAIDFEKGTDTAERVGPKRVTASGLIRPRHVKMAGLACFGGAALVGIPLLIRGGWPLLAIGLASIAAGYVYTGGPYPLAYNGLGEIFVMVFFGLVAVGGTYYLQWLDYGAGAAVAGIAAGSLANVLLAVNNLRDAEGDARTGNGRSPSGSGRDSRSGRSRSSPSCRCCSDSTGGRRERGSPRSCRSFSRLSAPRSSGARDVTAVRRSTRRSRSRRRSRRDTACSSRSD